MESGDESSGRGKSKKPSRKALFDKSPMRLMREISKGGASSAEHTESSDEFKPISLDELSPRSGRKPADEGPLRPGSSGGESAIRPAPPRPETTVRPLSGAPMQPLHFPPREGAVRSPTSGEGAVHPDIPSARPPPSTEGIVHPDLPPAHILLPTSSSEKDIKLPPPASSYKPLPSPNQPKEATPAVDLPAQTPKKKSGGLLSGLFSSSKKTPVLKPAGDETAFPPSTPSLPSRQTGPIVYYGAASQAKPLVPPHKPPSLPSASTPPPSTPSSSVASPVRRPLSSFEALDSKEESLLSLMISEGKSRKSESSSKPVPWSFTPPSPSGAKPLIGASKEKPPLPPVPSQRPSLPVSSPTLPAVSSRSAVELPKTAVSPSPAASAKPRSAPSEPPGFSQPLFTPTVKPASELKSTSVPKGGLKSFFGAPRPSSPPVPTGTKSGSMPKAQKPSLLSTLFAPKPKSPSLESSSYALKSQVKFIVRDEPVPKPSGPATLAKAPITPAPSANASIAVPSARKELSTLFKPTALGLKAVPEIKAKPLPAKTESNLAKIESKPLQSKPALSSVESKPVQIPESETAISHPSLISSIFKPHPHPPDIETEAYALKPRVKLIVHEESVVPKRGPAIPEHAVIGSESRIAAQAKSKPVPIPPEKPKAAPMPKEEPEAQPVLAKPVPAHESVPSVFSQVFSPRPLGVKQAPRLEAPKIGFMPSGRPSMPFVKKQASKSAPRPAAEQMPTPEPEIKSAPGQKPESKPLFESVPKPEFLSILKPGPKTKPAPKPEVLSFPEIGLPAPETLFKPVPKPQERALQPEPRPVPKPRKSSIVSRQPLQVKPAPKIGMPPVPVKSESGPASKPASFESESVADTAGSGRLIGESVADTLREEPSLFKNLLGALGGEKKAPPEPEHIEPPALSDAAIKPPAKTDRPALPINLPPLRKEEEEEAVLPQPTFVKKMPAHPLSSMPGKSEEPTRAASDFGLLPAASKTRSGPKKGDEDLFKQIRRAPKEESEEYAEPAERKPSGISALPGRLEVGPRAQGIRSLLVLDEGSIDRIKPADLPPARASAPAKPYMLEAVDPREFNVYYRKDMELPRFQPAECDRYFSSATLEQKKFLHALLAEQLYWRYKGEAQGSAGQRKCEAEFMGTLENSSAEQRIAIELAINLTKGIKAVEIFTSPSSDPKDAKEAYAIYSSLTSAHPGVKPLLFYLSGRLSMKRAYSPNSLEPARPFLDMISRSDDELRDAIYAYRAAFFDRLMNSSSASSSLRQWSADRYARILMARPQVSSKLDHYLKVHQGLELFFATLEPRTADQQHALQEEWMRLINNHAPTRAVVYYLLANLFSRPPYVSALWRTVLERPVSARSAGKK
ncbi:MAG: hypothetical protein V1728_00930 [Candidatus Micrarchaeota archaeon]